MLRLSGSNTIGASLGPSLAEAFLKDQGATEIRVLPGTVPDEKIVQGVLPGDQSPSIIKIAAHGSATAFTDLADNDCDIGMASRRIKPDEAAKLSSLGDMYSPASEHVLGLDGIAVIVNAANPVSALEKDQVMKIFTGDITDWSQVSAFHGAIKIYARDDKSGTFDTFKSLVLTGKPLAPGAQRFEDSTALSEAVAGDPNGIGFIGLPYIHSAKAVAMSEKGARPLLPSRLTVATEDYLLSRRLYLYSPAAPQNKVTQKFVEFALSRQGQDVVGNAGFVAQNVVPQSQEVAEGAPAEYKQLTQGAERLSLNFRFRAGKTELDNKALVDVDRVVTFIADLKYTGDKILLFGFADGTGTREANYGLSLSRAEAVEDQFAQRGLKPGIVRGFGADLPVASNKTNEGREKNRRVEIWVRR
jgi:phosphate transport system substrate-binding protein